MHHVAWLDGLDTEDARPLWQHVDSTPVQEFSEVRDSVVLVHDPIATPLSQPDCLCTCLQDVSFLAYVDPARLFLPKAIALQVGAGFPMQHLTTLGWFPRITQEAAGRKHSLTLTFQPQPGHLRLRQEDIAGFCFGVFFRGGLNARQHVTYFDADKVLVKVQIEGKTIWKGQLVGSTTFADILLDWQLARQSVGVGFLTKARVGSGPLKPDPSTTMLEAICSPSQLAFKSRAGHVLITIFPETRGGGAKDEKYATCQTQLAKEFLEHGIGLADASALVDKLLPQAGQARVQRVLSLTQQDNRWHQVLQLCRQYEITLPVVTNRIQQAQQRVRAKAKARAQAQQQHVRADSFRIQEEFFFNADGSVATLLPQISPGCSGVVLMDAEEAAPHLSLKTMDELGILILGHTCPHAPSCSGQMTVPAFNSVAEPVLLKACLRQLGERKLTCRCRNSAEVTTESAICCAFTAFQDDWTESEWKALTANPVRKVAETWKQVGILSPFTSPWGRSFRSASESPSGAPGDTMQFHARVCENQLAGLLQKSGFNRIYVTPKSWTGEILPGYAVIWLQATREEISAIAMTLQEQAGLIRSRARLGVRVSEQAYVKAFQHLRPGETPPARMPIRNTYKLSGLLPGLRGEDLTTWGNAISWPLRPLRPVGPRQWIVGAAAEVPAGLLSFNEHPILVQKVVPKSNFQPVVCAGRVPETSGPSSAPAEDPLIHNDPWKQFLQRSKSSAPATTAQPRQVAAPTEEKFKEHERRFEQLEATLQEVTQNQGQLKQDNQQLRKDVQVEVSTFRKEISAFSSEIERQMQANKDAMQQAQYLQQSHMSAGFAEIKALLQAQRPEPQGTKREAIPSDEPGGMNDL